ncbi:MAG: alkaline phosphatase family protein [Acidimicrobiales bacterium]
MATGLAVALVPFVSSAGPAAARVVGPLPNGAITHVMVIDLENEAAADTFGSAANEPYLVNTLEPLGTLVANYFAIGHVSLDNYIAQVSGQAPNALTSSDCLSSAGARFQDMGPGTLDPKQTKYPGQVDGIGCVMPPRVQNIGNQLDATYPKTKSSNWREYGEDMGNDPARDHGVPDPLGGTDCAHPVQANGNATDPTESAEGPNGSGSQRSTISDQYVDRHNPFIYFHSVIDNPATCHRDVVPLGTVTVGQNGAPNRFKGHLAKDLAKASTTPRFSFVSPNVCDDGHDGTCAGHNTDGTTAGGFAGINAWLMHWMPLILSSPAYRSGKMLVVITADEGSLADSAAGDHEQPGPNDPNPGSSPLLHPGQPEPPAGT